jgi:hypothetical protein
MLKHYNQSNEAHTLTCLLLDNPILQERGTREILIPVLI